MKRIALSWVALLIVVSLLLGVSACAKKVPAPAPAPAPAPTPVPTPTPTPKPTAAPAPITLKFGHWNPPAGAMPKGVEWYLAEVEKRSAGRIKFERYWAESLAPAAQQLDALRTGIADMTTIYSAYYPGKLPLGTIGSIAWYLADDVWTCNAAFRELYEQVPALRDELAQYKTKYVSQISGAQSFIFTIPLVKTLADLKGRKIYARGEQAIIVKELGVAPVSMTAPEVFTAVQTKTIDGAIWSYSGIAQYGINELVNSCFLLGLGTGCMVVGVNQDVWNRIPEDLQKMMMEVGKEHLVAYHQIYQVEGEQASRDKMKARGVLFTTPTAEEKARVDKIIKDILITKWIADQQAAGRPGQMVFDTLTGLIKKYEPLNPFKK